MPFNESHIVQHIAHLPPELRIPVARAKSAGRAVPGDLLEAAAEHLVRVGVLVPPEPSATSPAPAVAPVSVLPMGDTDKPISNGGLAINAYPSRAQARGQAPVEMRAEIEGHPHATDAESESELVNSLMRSWQPDIEAMANTTAALPSKGIGHLIRKGVRARGYGGREAVVIERLVWRRRKEIVEQRKAARKAALGIIEVGLTG